MSSSNNRFGRRTGGQSDNLRSEPSLSFNPQRPGARDGQSGAVPPVTRTPPSAPRADRADAAGFGARSGRDAKRDPIPSFMRGPASGQGSGPELRAGREDAEELGIERHDEDFDPRRAPREKAMEPQIPAAERPLYHHLFDDEEKRGHGFGWAAALGSVVILIVGGAYAWHNFMARPAPGNLFEPPGVASRGPDTGYTTPTQPTNNGHSGLDSASTGATPAPLAPAPLTSTPPDTTPPTRDVAVAPQPKDVPAAPPAPPKKTIAEAAANPGNLGPPVTPPPSAAQPAIAPAPVVTPPAPTHETPKREAPRREAAITPPKPVPAPAQHDTQPQDVPPSAVTQPAAAPAVSAPPPRRHEPQATRQPQQLNRNAPAAYPPPPQPQQQPQQQQPNFATRSPPPANFAPDNSGQNNAGPNYGAPNNAGPNYAGPANAAPQPGPDTVTVDGVTYVNGQEPHALGTLGNQPQAASDAPMPPGVPYLPAQSPPSTRYYAPADRDGGAPLPNDVIILPNGQMAVPNGQQ
ncbi:MAG TPA: hypothetical protein VHY80_07495 [Stellaceae bacterium]|nr:hypothetical protein [Stellaceae bacterium]